EDRRSDADAPRGPCRRRTVIAGRRRHDIASPALQRRQRAPPLERAELVGVLALEVDPVPKVLERRRHDFETTLGTVHVESTVAASARRLELSPSTFRRLALGSAGWLWLIVVTGATVRLTSSGLGCEHWPGCTAGNPFPSKSYHSFIEFGNRIVSALTILATLVCWLGARFTRGVPRWTRRLALATFLGTPAQAPLGATTLYAR